MTGAAQVLAAAPAVAAGGDEEVSAFTRRRRAGAIEGEDETTRPIASHALVIADNIAVSDPMRGQGLGRAHAWRVLPEAGAEGLGIEPPGPFMRAEPRKRPEWRDLFS